MIKPLSKNKYKIIAEIGYDIDGKRKRKTEVFNGTKREAEKREFEIKQEYANKTILFNKKELTFEEYGRLFMKKYCEQNLSPKTIAGYETMLKKINDIIGKWLLTSIDTFTLNELYIKLRDGERVSKVSNNTLLHYYNFINLMFNQAIDWEILDSNPNCKVKRPKKEKKLVQCYDVEQIHTLLNGLDNECLKYQALIRLALDSGARRSEILALTWQDINFSNNVLTINKSLDVIKGKVVEKQLKNNSSYRNLVLTTKTTNVLRAYLEEQQMNNNFKMTNKIFMGKDNKPMYPTTCGKIFQKVASKYGLEKLNFHSLRHASASCQIALGIHPKEIQDRLGHSSMNITMSIYSHIFQANKVELANKLETIF